MLSDRLAPALRFGAVAILLLVGQACHHDVPARQGAASIDSVFADPAVSSAATLLGPADPGQRVSLALGLARNESALDDYLEEISNPGSPRYRRFLKPSEIADQFGPSSSAQRAVLGFMRGHGVAMTLDAGGVMAHGEATVAALSEIFSTRFGRYSRNGRTFIAPQFRPTLPQGLQGLVTHVLGLSTEPALDRLTKSVVSQDGLPTSSGTRSGCSGALARNGFTPSQIRTAYGIDALQNAGLQGQGIYMALVEESLFCSRTSTSSSPASASPAP